MASIKAQGRGRATVAHAQDAMIGAYNPAGMVHVGTRSDAGLYWLGSDPVTTVSDSTLTDANDMFSGSRGNNFPSGEFGVNYMVCESCDFSLGLCVYTLDYWKASYSSPFPVFGTTPAKMEFWQGVASPMFALRFERFAIGMSFDFIGQRLSVNGLENFDNLTYSTEPGAVTNQNHEFASQFTFTVGGMWDITRCLTLGASYQPRSFEGSRFRSYRGLVPDGGRMRTPRRLTAGLWYHPNDCFSISADVDHRWWKDTRLFNNNFPELLSTIENERFGSSGSPGFGWDNQFAAHVGADWTPWCGFTLRIGYRYLQQQINRDQILMNTLLANTVDQWATAGFTWECGCYEISGFYSYGVKREQKGPPEGINTSFGGGNYSTRNEHHAAGIGIGWGWSP